MKKQFVILLAVIFGLYPMLSSAQLVVTTPEFPSENDEVEIIFDATLGNGGLAGYVGDVYAHTGVLTDSSAGPSNWRYVKTDWGENTPETKCERIAPDLYRLVITPDVRSYYDVPVNEQIEKIALVFRSSVQVGNSYLEGKTSAGGDIFIDMYQAGLFTRISLPSQDALLVQPSESIAFECTSNTADSMFLYVDNTLIKSVAGNTLSHSLVAENSGKHRVKLLAKQGMEQAMDSMYYFVLTAIPVAELPLGIIDGINYLNDTTVTLCLYAPEKENVFVLGDFNGWEYGDDGLMNRTPDGTRYWQTITHLIPGNEYIFQYLVDGSIRIGDPYAEKVSDPWNDKFITEATYPGILTYPNGKAQGIATVLQTNQPEYNWQMTNFERPEKTDLVIYELLVRDFVAKHDYLTLIDTLSYLKRLGVNAIELMPVNEFEGNLSWGYNPNYYFAPDKYYGHKDDLKKFIDECHKIGIAVIIDMVLNHSFGTSPMVMLYWDAANNRPAENNPWFNPVPKHDYNVGFDFNHESAQTKALVSRVVKFWLNEYRVDGYRFDLSKGFTQKNTLGNVNAWGQYDPTRIAIWKQISDTIWSVDPETYVILEHFAENSEEKELSNYGMMLWASGTHDQYKDAAMGWTANSNFQSASYQYRGWNSPHLVAFMESHDEERMVYKNIKFGNSTMPYYNLKDTTRALARAAQAASFFYTIPGPKMIWQFGELGYDYSIDFNGRTGEKPIRWDYKNDYRRKSLYDVTRALIDLKTNYDVFRTSSYTLSLSGAMKKIVLTDPAMDAVVIGNFDVIAGEIVPGFTRTGKWYEFFSGDSLTVASVDDALSLNPGEYRIYTTQQITKPETGLGHEELIDQTDNLIEAVYPNPSSAGFNIRLNIPENGHTSVAVFDMTGRKIASLFEGNLANGISSLSWAPQNTSHRAAGMYILKVVTEKQTATRQLIVQ